MIKMLKFTVQKSTVQLSTVVQKKNLKLPTTIFSHSLKEQLYQFKLLLLKNVNKSSQCHLSGQDRNSSKS